MIAMGELASGVAHEINNPLGVISICVKEISDYLKNYTPMNIDLKEIRENIEAIKDEIQRCKRITMGLLDLARRTEHRRVPLDINKIIRNVCLWVRYKAEREHKEIKMNLDEGLPLIMGEVDTLFQVFLNIILNAIEFTAAGKSIFISTGKESNRYISVKIRDEGCGIPASHINKIFKPFFTTKPSGSGTGLGLPICLRIVKSHNGEISVESEMNKGSTFVVFLPVFSEPSLA